MTEALIHLDYTTLKATATERIKELERAALEQSALIAVVTNAETNRLAVAAQRRLKEYCDLVYDAVESGKAPLNELRYKMIALGKELLAEADEEGNRIGKLLADFQFQEQNRLAAERRLQDAEASKLERERDAKIAAAATVDEQQAIKDDYRERILAETKPLEPIRAPGQRIGSDWEIEVTDIWLLAKAHSGCVKIEPRISEIKALLDQGVTVKGVRAQKVVKAGVRVAKQKPIEV